MSFAARAGFALVCVSLIVGCATSDIRYVPAAAGDPDAIRYVPADGPVRVEPAADGQGAELGINLVAERTVWQSYFKTWREHPVAMTTAHIAAGAGAFVVYDQARKDGDEDDTPEQPIPNSDIRADQFVVINGDVNAPVTITPDYSSGGSL